VRESESQREKLKKGKEKEKRVEEIHLEGLY